MSIQTDKPAELLKDPLLAALPEIDGYRVLDPVVIYARLARGGGGAVYKGRHLRLDIDVAVKAFSSRREHSDAKRDIAVRRFIREAQTTASIKHQNLVGMIDVNVVGNQYFLVMEYIEGETAAERLRSSGRLSERDALDIVIAAARGLAKAHSMRVVHRDVKPGNIMIATDGEIRITDLGLAKAISGDDEPKADLTMANFTMGTPAFMSPEQIETPQRVSFQADVWSLGVTLFQLLTGQLPWENENVYELFNLIADAPTPNILSLRPDLGALSLLSIINKALKKDPSERYADCGEMLVALLNARSEIADTGMSQTLYIQPDAIDARRMDVSRRSSPDKDTLETISIKLSGVSFTGGAIRVRESNVPTSTPSDTSKRSVISDEKTPISQPDPQSHSDVLAPSTDAIPSSEFSNQSARAGISASSDSDLSPPETRKRQRASVLSVEVLKQKRFRLINVLLSLFFSLLSFAGGMLLTHWIRFGTIDSSSLQYYSDFVQGKPLKLDEPILAAPSPVVPLIPVKIPTGTEVKLSPSTRVALLDLSTSVEESIRRLQSATSTDERSETLTSHIESLNARRQLISYWMDTADLASLSETMILNHVLIALRSDPFVEPTFKIAEPAFSGLSPDTAIAILNARSNVFQIEQQLLLDLIQFRNDCFRAIKSDTSDSAFIDTAIRSFFDSISSSRLAYASYNSLLSGAPEPIKKQSLQDPSRRLIKTIETEIQSTADALFYMTEQNRQTSNNRRQGMTYELIVRISNVMKKAARSEPDITSIEHYQSFINRLDLARYMSDPQAFLNQFVISTDAALDFVILNHHEWLSNVLSQRDSRTVIMIMTRLLKRHQTDDSIVKIQIESLLFDGMKVALALNMFDLAALSANALDTSEQYAYVLNAPDYYFIRKNENGIILNDNNKKTVRDVLFLGDGSRLCVAQEHSDDNGVGLEFYQGLKLNKTIKTAFNHRLYSISKDKNDLVYCVTKTPDADSRIVIHVADSSKMAFFERSALPRRILVAEERINRALRDSDINVVSIRFDPDSDAFAIQGSDRVLFSSMSSIRSEPVSVIKNDSHKQLVLCDISGDGRTLGLGFWNDVFLFPSVLPAGEDSFSGYSHWMSLKNVSALTFADNDVLVSTGSGRIYRHTLLVTSGARSIELQARHCILETQDTLRRIACHPTEKILATVNSNNQVRLWRYDEAFLKHLSRR